MRPEGRDVCALWDILEACRNIQEFIGGMTVEQFVADKKSHFAVIAQIEIIGEATKRLSTEFRKVHPDIPWKQIAGMRDFLIHVYDQVDMKRVWEVATGSVPDLIDFIVPLLPPDETGSEGGVSP